MVLKRLKQKRRLTRSSKLITFHQEMKAQKKTKSLAVSNFSPEQLDCILADPASRWKSTGARWKNGWELLSRWGWLGNAGDSELSIVPNSCHKHMHSISKTIESKSIEDRWGPDVGCLYSSCSRMPRSQHWISCHTLPRCPAALEQFREEFRCTHLDNRLKAGNAFFVTRNYDAKAVEENGKRALEWHFQLRPCFWGRTFKNTRCCPPHLIAKHHHLQWTNLEPSHVPSQFKLSNTLPELSENYWKEPGSRVVCRKLCNIIYDKRIQKIWTPIIVLNSLGCQEMQLWNIDR